MHKNKAKSVKMEFEEIRKLLRDLVISQKKTDKRIDKLQASQLKTDEQLKKTDEQIRNLGIEVGNLTDGWGKFVEGLVAPSVPELFKELNINITGINERALRRLNGREMEIDLLCIGKWRKRNVILPIEVKSSLGIRTVKEYIEDLKHFTQFFNEYQGNTIIGVIAGIRVPSEVVRFAEKQGLYVLAPSGEMMQILNSKKFKPKIWH